MNILKSAKSWYRSVRDTPNTDTALWEWRDTTHTHGPA